MKNDLTIFVSGAKRLKEHRLTLKALVNNLNGENRLKGCPVTLNMFSYVNLGDNQAEYDEFIMNKTDIILFIIEGRMGEKTKEEFLLASEQFKKTGTPKMYVFMKDGQERTPEFVELERLISDHCDSYYIEYSNLEDLEYKVKERLNQEVDALMESAKTSPKKTIKNLKIWSWLATLAFAGLLFASVWGWISRSDDVTLLFIGGGSAVRCLEEEYKDVGNVYDYDNSICIAVPTSTSWPIISSEVMTHHAIKGDNVSKPFYPVCLSAMQADESSFLKMSSRNQFVGKGSVLSFYLGDDYLFMYVKKSYQNEMIDGKETITTKELADFLRVVSQQNVKIFTTEEGSGTLTYYQNSLKPYDIPITKEALGEHVDKFTDLTPKSKIRGDEMPYIMLGSRYYVAREVYDEGDCRPIKVLDENGDPIQKSIFLYFAGYNEDGGTSYWIPDAMVKLLIKIDPEFADVIKKNRIPRENERIIVSLNNYLPGN